MNTLQDKFNDHMNKYGKAIEINGVSAIVFFMEIEDKQDTDRKYIFAEVGELKQGYIISAFNNIWLIVTEPVSTNGVYEKAIVQRCNYKIKFIFNDGIVREFPTIINSKIFDVDTGTYISVAMGKIVAIVQNDSDNPTIKVDQRFIKMGNAFKVTGSDYTHNGLIVLTCDLDIINSSTDDIENEIANAKSYVYTLTISNGDTVSINKGETLQLTVSLQLNSTAVTDKTILYSSSNSEIATVDANGLVSAIGTDDCTITAYMQDKPDIKDIINISVQEVQQDNFTYEIVGDSEIISGYAATYTAKKYNNGVLVSAAQFDFVIIPGTTPTSAYTLTVTNDTQCSIKANAGNKNITLRATDRADSTKYIEKAISLANLF